MIQPVFTPISSIEAFLELCRLPGTPLIARIPGNRMQGGNVPEGIAVKSSALTVNRPSGVKMRGLPMGVDRLNVRLYGSTKAECETHYRAFLASVNRRLNVHLASGAVLYSVFEVASAQHLTDPDTQWPHVIIGVELRYSEMIVAVS